MKQGTTFMEKSFILTQKSLIFSKVVLKRFFLIPCKTSLIFAGLPLVLSKLYPDLKQTHFWVYFLFIVKFNVRNFVKHYTNIKKVL